MNLNQKAAFVLLGALSVRPAGNINAQIAVHPAAQQNIKNSSPIDKPCATEITHLPKLGGNKYDAELSIHVPKLGDGTGELRVLNKLMRYDVRFSKWYVGGTVTSTIWTDLEKDVSIEKDHDNIRGETENFSESFIANLGKVPVTNCGSKILNGHPVTVYHITRQRVTSNHGFTGEVDIDQKGVAELIEGTEVNLEKCGTYEPIKIEIVKFKNLDPNPQDMILPSLPANPKLKAPIVAGCAP